MDTRKWTGIRFSRSSPLRLNIKKALVLFMLLYSTNAACQIPQGFNYQALAMDASGNPLAGQTIGVRLIIRSDSLSGELFWQELHESVITNSSGFFSLVLGNGVREAGTANLFREINWSVTPKWLSTQIINSGVTHIMGSTRLWSVPYALSAGELTGSLKKLEVTGASTSGEEAIFEVKNKNGQTVFAVYNEGVRVNVGAGNNKAVKGGFAIGSFDETKQEPIDLMVVTRDSVRVYIYDDPLNKAVKGGFAIGGFDETKGMTYDYLLVSPDSIRMYIDQSTSKAVKGGFAIGGFDETKAPLNEYLRVSPDSVRIYIDKSTGKAVKGGFAIGSFDETKGNQSKYLLVTPDSTTIATANQLKRVSVKNPLDNQPLLSIDGSLRMSYDESMVTGTISYDGTKFYTYVGESGAKGSDTRQFVVTGAPEVSTESVLNVTNSSASISGTVLSDGGSEVFARGVCWSVSPGSTLADNSLQTGRGVGSFVAEITGLMGSTTYYVRAYATNSQFTNYGNEMVFTTMAPELPVVTTGTVNSITTTGAVSGGNVVNDGAATITSRGVCWNTTGTPNLSDSYSSDGAGKGEYTSILSSLQTNTTYFVRAYAINNAGISYGDEYSFATTDLPVLSTNPVTEVGGTSATSGGFIHAGGDLSIVKRGVCWNTTGNPTLSDNHTDNGASTGTFISSITGLERGKTYFVRAYATNTSGTAYGNEYFFTTLDVPTITTKPVMMVTGTSATTGGSISYNGGAVVIEHGLCWNNSGNPSLSDSFIKIGEGSGEFSVEVTGLTNGTTYYIKAYAVNSQGAALGSEQVFVTQDYATVLTSVVTDITYTTAKSGGTVTSDGGALITQRGVCWNLTGNPTLSDNFSDDGTGTGAFLSNITGLSANNTYFLRAYVGNSIGTRYGPERSFSTPTIVPPQPGLPVIGTVNVTTSSSGYHSGGYISSDGGSAVIQRGICWSINPEPTLSNNYTNDGTGSGSYTSLITNLDGCGTTYYIRAYATNSTGTGYGNQIAVVSGLLPMIESTTPANGITKISATSGGFIASDGGCAITERGIVWSRFPNPSVSDYKSSSGSGIGSFTAVMTGLYPNDTYYARSYAINVKGVIYGPEITFTTEAGTSGLKIGQFYAGGYIYYLDETGDHGLVCSTEDLKAKWGCDGIYISGTSTTIGSGEANTAIIIANCIEEEIAARLCVDLNLNGYSDWYLPSIDELTLIYNNLCISLIIGFKEDNYWSSSESNIDNAWAYDFSNVIAPSGRLSEKQKFDIGSIKAIRTF